MGGGLLDGRCQDGGNENGTPDVSGGTGVDPVGGHLMYEVLDTHDAATQTRLAARHRVTRTPSLRFVSGEIEGMHGFVLRSGGLCPLHRVGHVLQ